jgi:ribonuclease HI
LDHVPIDRSVLIHTDSNYSIKCLTEWFQKWETNNWKSSSGKDVENKDLVEPIIARIRERDLCRAKTEFKWIKGHANDPGNTAADLLAVQGSRNSTPDMRAADIKDISATLGGRPGSKLEETFTEKKEVYNEEDGAEYDKIFADLAAERSTQKDSHGLSSDVVAQLTEASTWDGQEPKIPNEGASGPTTRSDDTMDVL